MQGFQCSITGLTILLTKLKRIAVRISSLWLYIEDSINLKPEKGLHEFARLANAIADVQVREQVVITCKRGSCALKDFLNVPLLAERVAIVKSWVIRESEQLEKSKKYVLARPMAGYESPFSISRDKST